MNLPPLPYPQMPGNDYTGADMQAYGQQCAQHALQMAAENVRLGQAQLAFFCAACAIIQPLDATPE